MRHHTASISDLFLGSAALVSRKKIPVAIAVLVFAMVMAVGSAAAGRWIESVDRRMAAEQSLPLDAFQEKMRADIDAVATMPVQDFMAASEGRIAAPEHFDVVMGYLRAIAPAMLAEIVWNLAALFAACVFFLLLFSHADQSAFDAATALPVMTVKMIGLGSWMLVRSLIWIPFAGLFIAVYMIPRLCLAPAFLAYGEDGIFESLHKSMRRTSGRFGMVFLRLVLIHVVLLLLLWPLLVLVAAAALLSLKLGLFLWLCVLVALLAYKMACLTVLAAGMK